MTGWSALDRFLLTDPADVGCEQALQILSVYVELALVDPARAETDYPGVAAHLAACGPCDDDYQGLLDAARSA